MTGQRIRSIVEQTNDLGADLIVLLGDYVAGHRFVMDAVQPDEWSKALSGLAAPLVFTPSLETTTGGTTYQFNKPGKASHLANARWRRSAFQFTR